MKIKRIEDENLNHYKTLSMVIAFPNCTFKCEKECGQRVCHNSTLASAPIFEIKAGDVVWQYLSNPMTHAIVCAGLEPIDSFDDLIDLISTAREAISDDIVIYTGYRKEEIEDKIDILKQYENIVVKYGRFVPNKEPHYDPILCVKLANDEQYAERIS